MISLTGSARIFFCKKAIDLRKGFEGLSAIVEGLFPAELTSRAYFVFLNLRANRMKVLYWDLDGLVIWSSQKLHELLPDEWLKSRNQQHVS
jgi:transposase